MTLAKSLRWSLACRLLGATDKNFKADAIRAIAEGTGVVYGVRIQPNPDGAGLLVRPADPRRLHIISCSFDSVFLLGEPAGDGIAIFTDEYEFHHAAEARR